MRMWRCGVERLTSNVDRRTSNERSCVPSACAQYPQPSESSGSLKMIRRADPVWVGPPFLWSLHSTRSVEEGSRQDPKVRRGHLSHLGVFGSWRAPIPPVSTCPSLGLSYSLIMRCGYAFARPSWSRNPVETRNLPGYFGSVILDMTYNSHHLVVYGHKKNVPRHTSVVLPKS